MSTSPSDEEIVLIRDIIMLPLALTYVENVSREIALIDSPLQPLYAAAAESLKMRIHLDMVNVKKALKQNQIRVWEVPGNGAINYRYSYRGYEASFTMLRTVAKADLSVRVAKYIRELEEDIRKNASNRT